MNCDILSASLVNDSSFYTFHWLPGCHEEKAGYGPLFEKLVVYSIWYIVTKDDQLSLAIKESMSISMTGAVAALEN